MIILDIMIWLIVIGVYFLPMIITLIHYFYRIYRSKKFKLSDIGEFVVSCFIAVIPFANWVYVKEEVHWFVIKDFTILEWGKED